MNLNSHVACNDVIVVSQGRYANIMMLHSFSAIQSQYSSLFFPCKANWRRFEERRFLPLPIRKLGQPCEFFGGIKTQYSKFVGFWLHVFSNQTKGNAKIAKPPRTALKLHPQPFLASMNFRKAWGVVGAGGGKHPLAGNPLFPYVGSKAKDHSTLDVAKMVVGSATFLKFLKESR